VSDFILRPDWPAHARVRAAQTLRCGGVSRGAFASLNVAAHVGDDPEAVAENRARLKRALGLPAEPLWLTQLHGVDVADADSEVNRSTTADAVVVRSAGKVCVIQTADCLPVLIAHRDGTCVAAAHAGWRGLSAGVLEATVRALGEPADRLIAWFGPAIGPAAFEVGHEVRAAFLAHDARAAGAFVGNARGRWQADLDLLARQRLLAMGLEQIFGGGLCTAADSTRFFSHRRAAPCGRMATLIWLDP
jgi:YfiH family protein